MSKSGIYWIYNKQTHMCYVGSAANIKRRWDNHKSLLNMNKHYNPKLQYAWNKYGEELILFQVLELIEDKSKLIEREQYYLDSFKSYKQNVGYNLKPTAGSCLGYKHTEEQKRKRSAARKGFKISEEVKMKISISRLGNDWGRKRDKWPCELGSRCKCEECSRKKYEKGLQYDQVRKNKNVVGEWRFVNV